MLSLHRPVETIQNRTLYLNRNRAVWMHHYSTCLNGLQVQIPSTTDNNVAEKTIEASLVANACTLLNLRNWQVLKNGDKGTIKQLTSLTTTYNQWICSTGKIYFLTEVTEVGKSFLKIIKTMSLQLYRKRYGTAASCFFQKFLCAVRLQNFTKSQNSHVLPWKC